MKEKNKIKWFYYITLIAAAVLLFVLMYKAPFRRDDLAWGSERGIQRLRNGFRGYNGRYIGNLIVLVLTRLPLALTVTIEMLVMGVGLWNVWLIFKKSKILLMIFCSLALLAPHAMFNQTILWVAGFSNFVVSAVFVFYFFRICLELMENKEIEHKAWMGRIILVFLGQLILETGSIYMIFLFLFTGIYIYFQEKKVPSYLIAYFVSACGGAALMFLNSSYRAAVSGNGDTYKKINISGSFGELIRSWWEKYAMDIFPNWIENIPLINLVLIACIFLLCFWSCSRIAKIIQFLGILFASWIIFNIQNPRWNSLIPYGEYLNAAVGVAWIIYIFTAVIIQNTTLSGKRTLIFIVGSQLFVTGPLIIADPLNERCFFQNYLFWVLLICSMMREIQMKISERELPENVKTRLELVPNFLMIGTLCVMMASQFMSWRVEAIRKMEIKKCREEKSESLVLPNNPSGNVYCFGDNTSNSNREWINKYKMYYDIPDEVELTFIEYNAYIDMKKEEKK